MERGGFIKAESGEVFSAENIADERPHDGGAHVLRELKQGPHDPNVVS